MLETVLMEKIFEVKNLCYKYPSAKCDVLKDITFDVYKGEIFGLLGHAGCYYQT